MLSLDHRLETILFTLAVAVYLVTRLIGLQAFPIYFFTDEAVQTVLAADLVRDDYRNYDKDFLPTYFVNGGQYNLGISVYWQVIPYLIFGKSELATRGASVLATLIGVLACGLILKDIFKVPYSWAGVLVLSLAPAWFLHSRTAFETVLATSFYAGFVYFYLLYRCRSPRYLYPALLLGAFTFYSYSPAQMVMAVTGLFLLVSDARYHWQNRATLLKGAGLLALLALPYMRFLITRSAENLRHLQQLNSYWTEPLPLIEKLRRYAGEYLTGINPGYWFFPNNKDLARHLMRGYGHLPLYSLPFMLVGLGISLRHFLRSPAHRVLLIALLAAPSGAALVQVGITRTLIFVIPACLLISLGLCAGLMWVQKRWGDRLRPFLASGLFVLLAGINFYMLRDALVNGPLWYADYGLGGMQYGARQLFGTAQDYLKSHPYADLIITPSWANGTDVLARFFLPDNVPIQLGSIDGYIFNKMPLSDQIVFVMIPDEYQRMIESGKFTDIRIDQVINYPDGSLGFYFVHLRYVDNIDAILAKEREARQKLSTEPVTIAGQPARVSFPMLDMGPIANVFDGDENTLVRSLEANPLVFVITFKEPRPLTGVTVRFGGTPTRLTVSVDTGGPQPVQSFRQDFPNAPLPRDGTLEFGQTLMAQTVTIAVQSTNDGEPAHVHVWEINFPEK